MPENSTRSTSWYDAKWAPLRQLVSGLSVRLCHPAETTTYQNGNDGRDWPALLCGLWFDSNSLGRRPGPDRPAPDPTVETKVTTVALTNYRLSGSESWNTPTAWSQGHKPLEGEIVVFPAELTQSVLTDLDQSGTPVTLELLHLAEGCRADIGELGNSLVISAEKVVHQGLGSLSYEDDVATGHIIIDAPRSVSQVAATITGTNIGRISCQQGKVVIPANITAAPDILEVGFGAYFDDGAELVVVAGGPTMPLLLMYGGDVFANTEVTLAIQGAGTLTKELTRIQTLYLMGGNCVYNVEDLQGSEFDFDAAYVVGGTLDFTRTSKTTGVENLSVYPKGLVLRNSDLVTFTNKFELGGRIVGGLGADGGSPPI